MNVDKTFLETHRVEEMREIINKMTQEIDSKVDNQKLIDSVDDYNKFMKDSSQKANKTLEETAEEMKIKKAINNINTYNRYITITNLYLIFFIIIANIYISHK